MATEKGTVLEQLVSMSRSLGDPSKDYVVLAEGNTSAKIDPERFYVKASGVALATITEAEFIEMSLPRVLKMLETNSLSDKAIREHLMAARVEQREGTRPSVETTFHASLLSFEGVNFVGHTHPAAVNAILCSKQGKEIVRGRIFPDEVVYTGREPLWIDYADPGLALAKSILRGVRDYLDRHGSLPKVVLLQNHGLVALGSNPQEVEYATAMWVKTARILMGTQAFGGPNYLSEEQVKRLDARDDIEYRRQVVFGR
jgi:rhamnose utilization protein RhaD (predicted bifunctional aldolase and dehydrogenase)